MMSNYEADFAICLAPHEAEDVGSLAENYYYWNGWRNHHWPADVIRAGVRLYGFDPRPGMRRLCVLLEITKGGSFKYRKKSEFYDQVTKLTRLEPSDTASQWANIPELTGKERPCTGVVLRWKVIKEVSIPLKGKFPRIGWLWLKDKKELEVMRRDLSDLYAEGIPKLRRHIVWERNATLREASKSYWFAKMGQKLRCLICNFDFGKRYKGYGNGFIEMHHLEPISKDKRGKKYKVQHLVPICSNCHRILHWKRIEPLPIKLLKEVI